MVFGTKPGAHGTLYAVRESPFFEKTDIIDTKNLIVYYERGIVLDIQ